MSHYTYIPLITNISLCMLISLNHQLMTFFHIARRQKNIKLSHEEMFRRFCRNVMFGVTIALEKQTPRSSLISAQSCTCSVQTNNTWYWTCRSRYLWCDGASVNNISSCRTRWCQFCSAGCGRLSDTMGSMWPSSELDVILFQSELCPGLDL